MGRYITRQPLSAPTPDPADDDRRRMILAALTDPQALTYAERIKAEAVARRAWKAAIRAQLAEKRNVGKGLIHARRLAMLSDVASNRPGVDGSGTVAAVPDAGVPADRPIPF
jgi:hypothetical protein